MKSQSFPINKSAFNELCEFVCCQMRLSGSEQKDRETLNFAIYWQITFVCEERIEICSATTSKIKYYQQLIQAKIDEQEVEWFDVSEIINRNITTVIQNYYGNTYSFSPFRSNNFERLGETFFSFSNKLEFN